MVGRTEAFKTDFARSLRPASMARCTGSSGGFASYRRDPLLGTYREVGAGVHVRAVECVQGLDPNLGTGPRMPLVTTFSTASSRSVASHQLVRADLVAAGGQIWLAIDTSNHLRAN